MARQKFGKLKILYLKDILEAASHRGKALSMRELIEQLNDLGFAAERKSVGDDLAALKTYGLPIERTHSGHTSEYFIRQNP